MCNYRFRECLSCMIADGFISLTRSQKINETFNNLYSDHRGQKQWLIPDPAFPRMRGSCVVITSRHVIAMHHERYPLIWFIYVLNYRDILLNRLFYNLRLNPTRHPRWSYKGEAPWRFFPCPQKKSSSQASQSSKYENPEGDAAWQTQHEPSHHKSHLSPCASLHALSTFFSVHFSMQIHGLTAQDSWNLDDDAPDVCISCMVGLRQWRWLGPSKRPSILPSSHRTEI